MWDFSSAHGRGALYRPHSRLIPAKSPCVLAAVKLLSDDASTQATANGRGGQHLLTGASAITNGHGDVGLLKKKRFWEMLSIWMVCSCQNKAFPVLKTQTLFQSRWSSRKQDVNMGCIEKGPKMFRYTVGWCVAFLAVTLPLPNCHYPVLNHQPAWFEISCSGRSANTSRPAWVKLVSAGLSWSLWGLQ